MVDSIFSKVTAENSKSYFTLYGADDNAELNESEMG
jgi:hypothetical protein